jgi:hypothetical protein
MFGGQIFIEAKIYELERSQRRQRQVRSNPDAETPRSGVGLIHEVFRRIAEA